MRTYIIELCNAQFSFYINEKNPYENLSISPPHIHALAELFIILDGNAEISTDKVTKTITHQEVCIIRPTIYHHIKNDENYTRLAIDFSVKEIKNKLTDIDLFSLFSTILSSDEPFVTPFSTNFTGEIFNCLKYKNPFNAEKLKGLLLLIFIEISKALLKNPYNSSLAKTAYKKSSRNEWLSQNYPLFYNYFIGKTTLNELCEQTELTARQLSRICCAEFSMNLTSLRTETRMRQALFYLTETKMTIDEITATLNFSSKESFSICFKKHFGIPPATARKNKFKYLEAE